MKKIIKNLISLLGYEISKKKKFFDFNAHSIDFILDIGAHKGQFINKVRQAGFTGKIISFEPQKDIHKELGKIIKNDTECILHPRCAIGEKNKLETLNIFSETQCSSILNPNKELFNLDNTIKKIRTEECEVFSLDYIIDNYYNITENTYLKIDTQGYDKNVLDGFKKNIKKIKFIQIEAGLYKLYENEEYYEYFINLFKSIDYELWDIKPFAFNKLGGLVQFDLIFRNKRFKNNNI